MKRISAALFVFVGLGLAYFVLAGRGQSASQKLVGTWKCDLIPAMVPGGAADSGVQAMLEVAEAAGMGKDIVIEFRDDKTATMSGPMIRMPLAQGAGSVERRWKVREVDGDKVTLEISVPDGQKSSTMEITFVDDDHFEFNLPAAGGKSLVFARVKQE